MIFRAVWHLVDPIDKMPNRPEDHEDWILLDDTGGDDDDGPGDEAWK